MAWNWPMQSKQYDKDTKGLYHGANLTTKKQQMHLGVFETN